MKSTLIFIVGCFLSLNPLSAQNAQEMFDAFSKASHILYGAVGDMMTHACLTGVKAELLTQDSVRLFVFTNDNPNQSVMEVQAPFMFPLNNTGKYILRFSKEGYETKCVNYEILKFYKREKLLLHKPVYLRRKSKERVLGEATVTATKVKFYNKGDTLVFNADAFQLQEGSMLDALIRQLPGVELKADGSIYVNGKYVESLLLNGEDFFKKDRSVMLENLPTYMVNKVQVYKKSGKLSEMLGTKVGDESLVMDVKLKKQYSIGWIGNAEAAAGTEDRYLARLFALRFSDHSRLSFFGAVNNVNEYVKPGVGSEWKPAVGSGLTTTRHGGLDYLVNDRNKRFKVEGDAEVRHSDDTYGQRSVGVNFLSGGDTYSHSSRYSRVHNVSVLSHHDLNFNGKGIKGSLKPFFSYVRTRQQSGALGVTFSQDPSQYIGTAVLDSLFRPDLDSRVLSAMINRSRLQQRSSGHSLNMGFSGQSVLAVPHSPDRIMLEARGNYADSRNRTFSHKLYEYPASGDAADFRNEYGFTPERSWAWAAKLSYWSIRKKNWTFQPYYEFGYNYRSDDRALMRLDRLDEWGTGTLYGLGELPSVAGWQEQALDGRNSVYAAHHDDSHTLGLYLHKEPLGMNFWKWTFSLPISFTRNRLDYLRPALIDTSLTRHVTIFRPSLRGGNTWYRMDENGSVLQMQELDFGYSLEADAPSLVYGIDICDDYNPLAVTLGNPDLKNTWKHNWNVSFRHNYAARQRILGVNAAVRLVQNALVMGYVYNKETGVQTFRPDNVNGNWTASGGVNYSTPLDSARRITLNTSTTVSYNHNVDLIGTGGLSSTRRSIVRNLLLTQGLRLDWRLARGVQLGAKGSGTWTHAAGRREDFNMVDAADFSYGATAQLDLPLDFQISTDITVYSRRGYEDASMNADDVIWNARVAKRFLKGRVSVMLDGFDLLGNLSAVRRTLNGQARVETWYNTIPRYAMLHLVYRLNVQPRKRP